ncbi:conserved Plasmodium membrane protein, unknown function [Plasmodium sp. DRC-Itaito]|nr:conserved Plasmodium membrane protein, unknown function [Plasmodium sp. DRC-Itaito]
MIDNEVFIIHLENINHQMNEHIDCNKKVDGDTKKNDINKYFDVNEENILSNKSHLNHLTDNENKKNKQATNKIKNTNTNKNTNKIYTKVSYENVCNKIYEEIKRRLKEENFNIYVFYPLLSILCKYNNDINITLSFFYDIIDKYIKDSNDKLSINKNEMILIMLCLNYIHVNISSIPNFYSYLITIYHKINDRCIKNVLLYCLCSCLCYSDMLDHDIINILNMHIQYLMCIYKSNEIKNNKMHVENIKSKYYHVTKEDEHLSVEKDKINCNKKEYHNEDNYYFYISLNNLTFYIYKHYNNNKFDDMLIKIYEIINDGLRKGVNDIVICIANMMIYLYIRNLLDINNIFVHILYCLITTICYDIL